MHTENSSGFDFFSLIIILHNHIHLVFVCTSYPLALGLFRIENVTKCSTGLSPEIHLHKYIPVHTSSLGSFKCENCRKVRRNA